MKRLLLMGFCLFLLFASLTAQACRSVVVKQGSDYVRVFGKPQTIFVIKDDIDLGGLKVKIGEGGTLLFRGGSLSNGIVVGNNTAIKAENYEIFKRGYTRFRACHRIGRKDTDPPSLIKEHHNCLIIEGTWCNKSCGTNWTGLQNGSKEDVMLAIKNYVVLHENGAVVTFPAIDALGYESVRLPGEHIIDFNNSKISYPDDLSVWEDAEIALPKGATACAIETGYGLFSLSSNTTITNLMVDGKSGERQNEVIRLGVSCIISIGDAQHLTFDNVSISNVLGPAVTAQSKSKDITFRNCSFYNIGEHVIYSHQYLGYCHFKGCTFDTWDSERISEYRKGLDYVYKHAPLVDEGNVSYDELYRFELKFSDCSFYNPKRVDSHGRTLGGFITGTFPLVVFVENSSFTGVYPALNLGGSEKTGKACRMIVRNCNGSPYVYPSKVNSNIITEFYDCINIPFRVVYAKRYDGCELYLDLYEDNIENVSPSFLQEYSEPLLIKNCKFIDTGRKLKINHPLFHRPIIFENCIFSSSVGRDDVADVVTIKTNDSLKVFFYSCEFNIPYFRLVGGFLDPNTISVEECSIKQLFMTP